MIKLYSAKKEARVRDKKGKRAILQIGKHKLHLELAEVELLVIQGLQVLVNSQRRLK